MTLAEAREQLAALKAEYATAAAEANRLRAEADALRQASDEAASRAAAVARRARPLHNIIRREEERPGPDCPELAPVFDAPPAASAHVVHTVAGVAERGRRRGWFKTQRWEWREDRSGAVWAWAWEWRCTPTLVSPDGVPYGKRKPRIDPDVLAAAVAKCAAAREGQP